ncbi:MAG: hypothetical protein GY711_00675 [bacterium]|nr:hypothetical protein [bacterium]
MGTRVLVALVSATIALSLGWWVLRGAWSEPETVTIVDSRADVASMLRERNAAGEIPFSGELIVEALDFDTAKILYPAAAADSYRFDPSCYFRMRPGISMRIGFAEHPAGGWTAVTNDHGMLDGQDVREPAPEVRVLVTGDSHSAGLCAPLETFTHLLEVNLAQGLGAEHVETLNAALGGYDPYNYLGVLESFRALEPDVFVVVVFGGNDFYGLLKLQRFFHRRPPAKQTPHSREPLLKAFKRGVVGQELSQVVHFLNNPEDEAICGGTLMAITEGIAARCRERGVELLCVYLPPPSRGQPELHAQKFAEALASIGVGPEALAVSDRIGDRWLASLEDAGIEALDLRPEFAASQEDLYWSTDYHLDLAGHRLVGRILADRVRALVQ